MTRWLHKQGQITLSLKWFFQPFLVVQLFRSRAFSERDLEKSLFFCMSVCLSVCPSANFAKFIFRSRAFSERDLYLEVTFFSGRMSVCMYVRKFCEIQFFWKIELWNTSYGHLWSPSEPEVNRKWTGNEPELGRKWNARDQHAQGTCALRFF